MSIETASTLDNLSFGRYNDEVDIIIIERLNTTKTNNKQEEGA